MNNLIPYQLKQAISIQSIQGLHIQKDKRGHFNSLQRCRSNNNRQSLSLSIEKKSLKKRIESILSRSKQRLQNQSADIEKKKRSTSFKDEKFYRSFVERKGVLMNINSVSLKQMLKNREVQLINHIKARVILPADRKPSEAEQKKPTKANNFYRILAVHHTKGRHHLPKLLENKFSTNEVSNLSREEPEKGKLEAFMNTLEPWDRQSEKSFQETEQIE